MWLQLSVDRNMTSVMFPFTLAVVLIVPLSNYILAIIPLSLLHPLVLDLRKSPSCVARVFRRKGGKITRSHRNNVY